MLQNNEMPQRSRLYHLAPIGIGTGDVESITSYVVRLAEAHKVPVRRILQKIGRTGIPIRPYLTNYMNGYGDRTDAVVRYMQDSTRRTDLFFLTLSKLSDTISISNLLKKHFAWCPECLREAVSHGEPYHKLLWSLKAVECCPIHGLWLRSSCLNPQCAKYNSEVLHIHSILKCPSCGYNLYDFDATVTDRPSEQKMKVAHDLANLLQAIYGHCASISTIRKSLLGLSNEPGWNGIRAVAKKSHVDYYLIERWFTGKSKVQIDYLLSIAESFSTEICKLVVGVQVNADDLLMPPKTRFQSPTQSIRIKQIEAGLKNILETWHEPKSLNQIAKDLGTTTATLRRHFPELCDRIPSFRKHQAPDDALLGSICEYLHKLVSSENGPYPTLKAIGKTFGVSTYTLQNHFPKLCAQITLSGKRTLISEARLSSIRAYLSNIVNSENRPYPTLKHIAKTLGVDKRTLYRHFPGLCAQITSLGKTLTNQ